MATYQVSAKINPLRAKWPCSRYFSPVSKALIGWESLTPPGRDTNPSQVNSQQTLYSFIYPERMESWVSLGGKQGHTSNSNLDRAGIELGTLRSESRDLTVVPTMSAHVVSAVGKISGIKLLLNLLRLTISLSIGESKIYVPSGITFKRLWRHSRADQ